MTQGAFRLIERTGPNPGAVYDLTKDVTLVGRDVTNDVVVNDPEVSRQHARLTRTPGGFVLEDLGSTNGTFVNGERLSAPRILNPGDLIGLGEKVALTFDAVAPEAAATVVSPSAAQPAAPQAPAGPAAQPPPPPPTPPPAAAAPPVAAAEEEKRGINRWVLAGCGCLVLLAACGGFLWFMDAYFPDVLYGPIMPILRALGF